MKTNFFRILPLLLCVPSLMAVTAKDFKSQESYSDFSVNVKYLEPDLYELTINNYGDFYMSKGEFYKDEKYHFSYIPENEFEKVSISVIKPKETVTKKIEKKAQEFTEEQKELSRDIEIKK